MRGIDMCTDVCSGAKFFSTWLNYKIAGVWNLEKLRKTIPCWYSSLMCLFRCWYSSLMCLSETIHCAFVDLIYHSHVVLCLVLIAFVFMVFGSCNTIWQMLTIGKLCWLLPGSDQGAVVVSLLPGISCDTGLLWFVCSYELFEAWCSFYYEPLKKYMHCVSFEILFTQTKFITLIYIRTPHTGL